MKKGIKLLTFVILATLVFTSCSSDDAPVIVNEEELITTITVILAPDGGGTATTLLSRDLDGDGPNAPEVSVSGNLTAGTTYNGSIVLLNETVSPAENITIEVEAEDEEHQFFYTTGGGLDISTEYGNFDSNQNPLGTQFTLTTGDASSGTLTFTLRHLPTKPNTGLGDAGGETDISVAFDITVE
jgi:hypothetical protein